MGKINAHFFHFPDLAAAAWWWWWDVPYSSGSGLHKDWEGEEGGGGLCYIHDAWL